MPLAESRQSLKAHSICPWDSNLRPLVTLTKLSFSDQELQAAVQVSSSLGRQRRREAQEKLGQQNEADAR